MPDGMSRIVINKPHPLSDLFPLMQGEAYEALVNDIRTNGQRDAIVLFEGMVLDGRNRQRACAELDLTPKTKAFHGKDPLAYVISVNLHRRQLDESQRAMVATKIETMKHGGARGVQDANLHLARADAARIVNVSTRTVADAKKVRDKGTKELVEAVEQGKVAVSLAAKVAELPKDQQRKLVNADEGELRGAVKKARRADRDAELAAKTKVVSQQLGTKLYSVIYADPPWRFEPYSRETGMDRAADNHYPTEELDRIKAIKVPAADDCALFLWATVPMMREAFAVMEAWGFTYKSQCVWVKNNAGTGYWWRNQHEILLLGTRGNVPAPAPGEQFASVMPAKVGKHSEKPEVFAEMIEEMFPKQNAVELFARKARLGWDVWGNEAPT